MTKPDQVCAVKHDDRKNAKSDIWGFQQDFRFEFGHDFANSPYLKKNFFKKGQHKMTFKNWRWYGLISLRRKQK